MRGLSLQHPPLMGPWHNKKESQTPQGNVQTIALSVCDAVPTRSTWPHPCVAFAALAFAGTPRQICAGCQSDGVKRRKKRRKHHTFPLMERWRHRAEQATRKRIPPNGNKVHGRVDVASGCVSGEAHGTWSFSGQRHNN